MNSFYKITLLSFIIISIGCGGDGGDGEAYLRIRAVINPTNVVIDNPDIPTDFQYDVYYKTSPGSYNFSYVDHNGVQHPLIGEYGVVNILSNSGEEGGLFNSGDDGEDVYIDLILCQ